MLHLLEDMRLTRVAHKLRFAAQESEAIVELFALRDWNSNVCITVDDECGCMAMF
jgi:hypothetical protein